MKLNKREILFLIDQTMDAIRMEEDVETRRWLFQLLVKLRNEWQEMMRKEE